MTTAPVLAGVLVIATAIAQAPADPTPPASSAAEARLKELDAIQAKCIADWRQAVDDAKKAAANAKPGEAAPATPMRPDFAPMVQKAKDYAAEYAGTDEAVPFLIVVLQNVDEPAQRREVLDTLLGKHVDSPKLAQLGGWFEHMGHFVSPEYATSALAKLGNSAAPAVRGWAQYVRAKPTIETAARDGAEYLAARSELLKVAETAGDEDLASEIRMAIELREKFGVGNIAPDIDGVDLDGVAFKLSDYRGKVVFLDFWGDW